MHEKSTRNAYPLDHVQVMRSIRVPNLDILTAALAGPALEVRDADLQTMAVTNQTAGEALHIIPDARNSGVKTPER